MSTMRTLTLVAALISIAACRDKSDGKAAAPPAAGSAAPGTTAAAGAPGTVGAGSDAMKLIPEADAQHFLDFVTQLVAVVVANQDDCGKLAAAIDAHLTANKALIDDAASYKSRHLDMPPAIKKQLADKFRTELGPAVVKHCGQDPAVRAAFRKLRAS